MQDFDPVASPAPSTATNSWRGKLLGLLGSCYACGSTKVLSGHDKVRTAACMAVADTGLFPAKSHRSLTTRNGVCSLIDSDSCITKSLGCVHARLSLDQDSTSGNTSGSLSLLRSVRRRSNLCLVSCRSSSSHVPNHDSAWSSQSQASSFADTASMVTTMLHVALQQLEPLMITTQACEAQPISFSTRQLSKASHPSMNRSERSAASFTASGEHPQIPNCMSPLMLASALISNDAGTTHHFLLQPYEEEKRTWLQMKWQQQQDWLEMQQQGLVHPSSPRQLLQHGSKSLNVRVVQQPGRQFVGGEGEESSEQ